MRNTTPYALPVLVLLAVWLAGCGTVPVPGLSSSGERQNVPFEAMPLEAAAITSAIAAQTLSPPLASSGNVSFAPGAEGRSETAMALEGFTFTNGVMHAFRPAGPGMGMVAGTLGYACPLDRRADFLFVAEYEQQSDGYLVRRLNVAPRFSDAPRVQVFVLPLGELPRQRLGSYVDLMVLLADRALAPQDIGSAGGPMDVALLAVGMDRMASDSELKLGVASTSAGSSCYNEDCTTYAINGWPVAVLSGRLNPADSDALYAKVTFKDAAQGRFARTRLLCVHQLTGI